MTEGYYDTESVRFTFEVVSCDCKNKCWLTSLNPLTPIPDHPIIPQSPSYDSTSPLSLSLRLWNVSFVMVKCFFSEWLLFERLAESLCMGDAPMTNKIWGNTVFSGFHGWAMVFKIVPFYSSFSGKHSGIFSFSFTPCLTPFERH